MSKSCPIHGENCKQYNEGWSAGFCSRLGDRIPANTLSCFEKGWKQGVKDIDEAADEAFQRQYSLDL